MRALRWAFFLLIVLAACQPQEEPQDEAQAPQDGEWEILFDGESFAGWRGLGRDSVPGGHWVIEDGSIRKVASGVVPTAPDGQPLEGGDLKKRSVTLGTRGAYRSQVTAGLEPGDEIALHPPEQEP